MALKHFRNGDDKDQAMLSAAHHLHMCYNSLHESVIFRHEVFREERENLNQTQTGEENDYLER